MLHGTLLHVAHWHGNLAMCIVLTGSRGCMLTVVSHEAHGLGKGPLGGGVGGETPVIHCKGRRVRLILQVLVELSQG